MNAVTLRESHALALPEQELLDVLRYDSLSGSFNVFSTLDHVSGADCISAILKELQNEPPGFFQDSPHRSRRVLRC